MKIPEDILERLKADFKKDFEIALEKLTIANSTSADIRRPRINRCIVHLANGSLTELDNAISIAKTDWRDIILNAEYEYTKESGPLPKFDFRHGFNEI